MNDLRTIGDCPGKLVDLGSPGRVGVVPGVLFKRIAHVVVAGACNCQRFGAIAFRPRQDARQNDRSFFQGDIEIETVTPLGCRGMQHRHNAAIAPHQCIGVVLYVMLPVIVRNETVHFFELTAEQTDQVDHMDTLIEQDPAAGQGTVRPPRRLTERHQLGFSVNAFHVDDPAQFARRQKVQRFANRIVIAVVKPVFQFLIRAFCRRGHDARDIFHVSTWRLLAEHV